MRAEWRHRLEALFPDEPVGRRPRSDTTVTVPRGAVASANLLIDGLRPGAPLRVRVERNGRPAAGFTWRTLTDVPVERNTGPRFGVEKEDERNPHVIRRAPFRIFDALAPMAGSATADAAVRALRLDLPIPPDRRPGTEAYVVTVASDGVERRLRLTVRVVRPVVPPAGPRSFPYTNWFDYRAIASRHGLTLWSPAYWTMLDRYAALMAHGRQNAFWLPLDILFDGETLNRARLRRLVALFTRRGLHWIEGGHVANRFADGDLRAVPGGEAVCGAEGHAALARRLRPLYKAILEEGWRARWLQHVKDEARGEEVPPYRILCGLVRKYMPGLPLIDAVMGAALAGTPDIQVIQNDDVRERLSLFQAQRAFGDRVWLYTCMGPGGNGLNRLMDMELMRCTLLGWACLANGFDGFLHWGLNHYRNGVDPFRQSCTGDNLPAGDTHIVYPGPDGPWSSVRLEAQREGMEDLELLRRLHARDPGTCARIVGPIVRDCWHYTRAVGTLETARLRLYRALERTDA